MMTKAKETNKYDFMPKARLPKTSAKISMVNNVISYDYISLQFDLCQFGKEANFKINRVAFMRSNTPKIKAKENEMYIIGLYPPDENTDINEALIKLDKSKECRNIKLTQEEREQVRKAVLKEVSLTPYNLTKIIYPDCKLYYDQIPTILGNVHIYISKCKLYIGFSGKIVASKNSLGYINIHTINEALEKIKATDLISFDNQVFIKNARILRCDIVQDIRTTRPNILLKTFSSYLPLRTDKYAVIAYSSGYEVIQRYRKNEYEFCIYNKGKEISKKGSFDYKKALGDKTIADANNIIRLELRLFKHIAQDKFLAEKSKDNQDDEIISTIEDDEEIFDTSDLDDYKSYDNESIRFINESDEEFESIEVIETKSTSTKRNNVTLFEALTTTEQPIIQMLNYLTINEQVLKKARGKYLVGSTPSQELKIAEYQRMQGCLRLLEMNDYDFDKVRSHIEVETGKLMPSNYLDDMRERLQDYIACFKPQTVLTLEDLLNILIQKEASGNEQEANS